MNVIEIQERLKDLSDAQLQQVAQTPGMAPEFLVMNELNRRQRVREDYQASMAQNPSTVKQDLMSAPGIPSAAGAQMAQAMRPEGAQSRVGVEGAVPMAEGGIVAGLQNYDAFLAGAGQAPIANDMAGRVPMGYSTPLPGVKPEGIAQGSNEGGAVDIDQTYVAPSMFPTPLPGVKPELDTSGTVDIDQMYMGPGGVLTPYPVYDSLPEVDPSAAAQGAYIRQRSQAYDSERPSTRDEYPAQSFYRRLMRLFNLGD